MRSTLGWVLLALAAALLAMSVWDVAQPEAPILPSVPGVPVAPAHWYLVTGYLLVSLALTVAGAWLLRGSGAGS